MNDLVKNNYVKGAYLTKAMVILPGLITAFIVAVISKVIAIWLPTLGAATIAILLGILLGNTFLKNPILEKGTKIAEGKLLEFSVVLLGATVTFQTIAQIGIRGGIFVLFQMVLTIIASYVLGKKMQFSDNMSLLMAGGNAVCGSSAIASIAPAIHAKEEEKGQIITLVNLLGTILMLLLPIIASILYGTDILTKSALIGGILQSVGQVVASASMINGEVVELAMLFKIMRIMLLVVVVYFFGRFKQQRVPVSTTEETISKKKSSALPWYVVGFVLFCVINSLIHLPVGLSQTAHFFSGWFEITALAAIGLRLDFQKFFKEGKRFLIYGLSVGVIQVVLAIVLIFLLSI
ncbi:YeiH family protein [Enterococcus caccae]|uniref:Integral membrane protein n=1 Tax=Enterococcus caccae ATCC BAA-1240 TaxID=1158612 RepID=R3U1I0_9ENTE|nr:putative sulfate exporter family transporter [Enterococcus caccae]EOL47754.1 integral membrane protein [Enterococcus caccae ATCC BAA-1240]EOT65552.1 integral membrane protein [Enterococcus caccae ATCC BAA-1240]OJG27266.1 integral membrane protein [Enterococcus caccae]